MGTIFTVEADAEYQRVQPGRTKLWASLKIEAAGQLAELARAPLALVLVIDVSGSMEGSPISHALRSCDLVAALLDAHDQVALVTFAEAASVRCGLVTADELGRRSFRRGLAEVSVGGGTNLQAGLAVGAGLLTEAPPALRRVMVVLSDGRPNRGLASAEALASYVRGLGVGVSTLGFGLDHSEQVLAGLATAGSGRYAYIPDPVIARVDMARAALAHGGIVADQLEAQIRLAPGVELTQLLMVGAMRFGGEGVLASVGDIFIDEGRLCAMELEVELAPAPEVAPQATAAAQPPRSPRVLGSLDGRTVLAEISVKGRLRDGSRHLANAIVAVDVEPGPPQRDAAAQRDVLVVLAEQARGASRTLVEQGALPAAAQLLLEMARRIDGAEGFVRNDGSPLAELREQLQDEADNLNARDDDAERVHKRKSTFAFAAMRVASPPTIGRDAPVKAWLSGLSGEVQGIIYPLRMETSIGRGATSSIRVDEGGLSRLHSRILFIEDSFLLQDMGSTNGSFVNDKLVRSVRLRSGDVLRLGQVTFRFDLGPSR